MFIGSPLSRGWELMHSETYYKKLRKKYIPEICRLILVFESPPAPGKYFYDDSGSVDEPLYKFMMKCFCPFDPVIKKNGLKEFKRLGILLVDASYKPVNKLSPQKRKKAILKNYPNLEADLKKIIGRNHTKVLIVGTGLRKILEPLLEQKFYVINDGENLPFPLYQWGKKFAEKIRYIFNWHNVNLELYC
jgi:hypothetical protein